MFRSSSKGGRGEGSSSKGGRGEGSSSKRGRGEGSSSKRGRGEGSSSKRGRGKTPLLVWSYTDPSGTTWYGQKRKFQKVPINTIVQMSYVGHVLVGDPPTTYLPQGAVVVGEDLQWPKLFNKKCELEVYCSWHGLPIPVARSADLLTCVYEDNDELLNQLTRENEEMQRRLNRFHALEDWKNNDRQGEDHLKMILEASDTRSDRTIRNYNMGDLADDMDFQHYLPSSLQINGESYCCYEWRKNHYHI